MGYLMLATQHGLGLAIENNAAGLQGGKVGETHVKNVDLSWSLLRYTESHSCLTEPKLWTSGNLWGLDKWQLESNAGLALAQVSMDSIDPCA